MVQRIRYYNFYKKKFNDVSKSLKLTWKVRLFINKYIRIMIFKYFTTLIIHKNTEY